MVDAPPATARAPNTPASDTALYRMRWVVGAGVAVVIFFFGGLGGWAAVAPLDSAAIAPGVVKVESNRKTIQHLEGGIVAEILVRDGDRVAAGSALVRLDETRARSALEQLEARRDAALALEARLGSERDGADSIRFPPTIEPQGKAALGETAIFAARGRALRGQAAILAQRIAQYEKEIVGLQGQITAESTQLELVDKELTSHEKLRQQKLTGMQRMIELQRDAAEISGSRSRHVADIARAEQNIAGVRLEILDLDTRRVSEAVEQLRATQTLLQDLDERIHTAADLLARTTIYAPIAGIIVDLSVHTVGGVIAPGEAVMDIVPVGERLIIEARVNPEDIDAVHPGLEAQVVLTAFNRRNVPPMSARVISVSADRLTDPRTGLPYFLARIALPDQPSAAYDGLELYPGMQAEVMIVTGERTALDYFTRPVTRSFNRALRED